MGDEPDTDGAERALDYTIKILYAVLIAASVVEAYDAVKQSTWMIETRGRIHNYFARVKARAENCEGCAKRKAWLAQQAGRMHWDAVNTLERGENWDAATPGE